MDNNVNLPDLIKEGRDRANRIQYHSDAFLPYYDFSDKDAYFAWLGKTIRFLNIQYSGDKDVEKFEKISEEQISPSQQSKLLAILEAIAALPVIQKDETGVAMLASDTSGHHQTQAQNLFLEVFVEALHEELSKKQIREIEAIAEDEGLNDDEKKTLILNKIKDFDMDTLSNIVANVLANHNVWRMI